MNRVIRALCTLLICAPEMSQAQETYMFQGYLQGYLRTDLNNRLIQQAAEHTQRSTVPSVATRNPSVLRFSPSPATRRRNMAGFTARTRTQSPETADRMEQLFASTDVFAAMAQGLAPKGLRIDNVSDAYTVYWITAWQASRGVSGDTSKEQAQAVRAQVTAALLATPELVSAAATQKQELAEALLVQTALVDASMEQAAGDSNQKRAIAAGVRQGAKAMGLDLDAMTLTDNGFVPAGCGSD